MNNICQWQVARKTQSSTSWRSIINETKANVVLEKHKYNTTYEGCKAELTQLAGYIPRRYTRPETVTHPSTNRVRCGLTSFMRRTPLKGTGSPYSITERRVPELIPVLGSQPAGGVSHKPAVGCHYFPPGLQLPSQPLKGLLPISLLGERID